MGTRKLAPQPDYENLMDRWKNMSVNFGTNLLLVKKNSSCNRYVTYSISEKLLFLPVGAGVGVIKPSSCN